MARTTLTSFLLGLNTDPGLLAAFEADPAAALTGWNLSDAERQVLLSPDRYRALQSAQREMPEPGY
jgi:hypothetical protein